MLKAIELTEFACSLPQIAAGEVLEVSRGVECRLERHPLGVVASIMPFNFPSMVPHWTIPNAIALGNCMHPEAVRAGPAQRRPHRRAAARGGPAGRRVQRGARRPGGGRGDLRPSRHRGDQLRRLDPGRQGGLPPGHGNLKRVLALGGAKNHLIVLPDADPEMAASNIVAVDVAAAPGSAAWRPR